MQDEKEKALRSKIERALWILSSALESDSPWIMDIADMCSLYEDSIRSAKKVLEEDGK